MQYRKVTINELKTTFLHEQKTQARQSNKSVNPFPDP